MMGSAAGRFPPWLRKRLPRESETRRVREVLGRLHLHTVCQSAQCPNIGECFARGTATFMVLGGVCTRDCRFCAVAGGLPGPVDEGEPRRIAAAAGALGLRHVVVTSVTRDDLPDEGSGQFAATIQAIRSATEATVEVLTPDFHGRHECLDRVLEARPDVFGHNVETVPRLYQEVRPQADYGRSLGVLSYASRNGGAAVTKSGLMVGLGESPGEVLEVMRDLRAAGCDAVTLGQYLRPSPAHLPVARFVSPDEFKAYEAEAAEMGFGAVAAGPFVRSSYHAEALLEGLALSRRS